jgi:poly-gamma-glutamate capsule biosynthesis protein CapA/YwtB (metallophosphatase superfamily)
MRKAPPLDAAIAALCALAFASLLLTSCAGGSGGSYSIAAEPELLPTLEALIGARPLPRGWRAAPPGEPSDLELRVVALPAGSPQPRGASPCGTRYFAASVDLAAEQYSIDASRAAELGLAPLESIILPRRALAVDGLWPGKPGYPFVETLFLSAISMGPRRLPGPIAAWVAEAAASAVAQDGRPIDLAAAGDIQVGENQWPLLAAGEAGLSSLLRGGVLGLIRNPDLAIANLEAPISARGYPNPRKRFKFRMPPGSAAALGKAGFDLLLFGNNHAFDFGPEAFADTLADFESAGVPMVGAGRDIAEAAAARTVAPGPSRGLAFVGYAFYPDERLGFTLGEAAAGEGRAGVAANEAAAMESLRAAVAAGRTAVVLAHGGAEYVEAPGAQARALYARFVDAGAALVVGTHPHLLQGCEARSGSLIAYSLGNFLFTGEAEPPEALDGAVLDFLLYRGKVRGLAIHPIVAGYDFTAVDRGQAAAELRFSRLCADLSSR